MIRPLIASLFLQPKFINYPLPSRVFKNIENKKPLYVTYSNPSDNEQKSKLNFNNYIDLDQYLYSRLEYLNNIII